MQDLLQCRAWRNQGCTGVLRGQASSSCSAPCHGHPLPPPAGRGACCRYAGLPAGAWEANITGAECARSSSTYRPGAPREASKQRRSSAAYARGWVPPAAAGRMLCGQAAAASVRHSALSHCYTVACSAQRAPCHAQAQRAPQQCADGVCDLHCLCPRMKGNRVGWEAVAAAASTSFTRQRKPWRACRGRFCSQHSHRCQPLRLCQPSGGLPLTWPAAAGGLYIW
jgi:hypothetical protein